MMSQDFPARGRIAIFSVRNFLESYAFMRDAVSVLIENGYQVDMYLENLYEENNFQKEGLSILARPEAFPTFSYGYPRFVRWLPGGRTLYRLLMKWIYKPLAFRFSFLPFFQKRHAALPYLCLIGVDPGGLVSALPLAKKIDSSLAFWSLLLLPSAEIKTAELKRIKEVEKEACHEASFVISQDVWRGEFLAEDNGFDAEKLIYLPNSPRGKARRQRSDYLHRRLGIDPERKIILSPGMFGPWALTLEVAQAATAWSDEYVLVLQSHTPREYYTDQSYMEQLLRIAESGHVVLSFDHISSADYLSMIDSAEVGLAFYKPQYSLDTTQGHNVYLMGLASTKFASFLHQGLPVVANDAVLGPGELVEKWGCGISVQTADQVGGALDTIFQNYERYSANAIQCFDQELELEARFKQVLKKLQDF